MRIPVFNYCLIALICVAFNACLEQGVSSTFPATVAKQDSSFLIEEPPQHHFKHWGKLGLGAVGISTLIAAWVFRNPLRAFGKAMHERIFTKDEIPDHVPEELFKSLKRSNRLSELDGMAELDLEAFWAAEESRTAWQAYIKAHKTVLADKHYDIFAYLFDTYFNDYDAFVAMRGDDQRFMDQHIQKEAIRLRLSHITNWEKTYGLFNHPHVVLMRARLKDTDDALHQASLSVWKSVHQFRCAFATTDTLRSVYDTWDGRLESAELDDVIDYYEAYPNELDAFPEMDFHKVKPFSDAGQKFQRLLFVIFCLEQVGGMSV